MNHDNIKNQLAASDADIARVTEDLIELLISKNIILFTDLPEAVQRKLLSRELLRQNLSENNSFMDDSDGV